MTDEQRAKLRGAYLERRDAVFPKKAGGKHLTKAGEAEALSWLCGVVQGMVLAGVPYGEAGLGLCLLASVRGVDDALGLTEGQF